MKSKTATCLSLFFSLSFFIILTSMPAHAAGVWHTNLKVSHVAAYGSCYIIQTDSQTSICAIPGRYAIMENTAMAKEIYATALTAFLTGKLIDIYIPDTSNPSCHYDGTVAILIQIHD